MSRVIIGILVGLALGTAGAITLVKYPKVAEYLRFSAAEREQESPVPAEESFLQHDPNGQTTVKLNAQTQIRMGLKAIALTAATAPSEVKGYGRVLDPTPLAALVAERASAQVSLQASTKEYERVKTLYTQNQNASARAFETAEAAMSKDRIALESVRSRLVLGWGQEIASQADLPAFVDSLAARQAALIRVDLPLGEGLKAPPAGGRVAPVGAPEELTPAQVLGSAPSVDPQMQGQGFLLLAQGESGPQSQNSATGSPSLPPGTGVIGWLTAPGDLLGGVRIPQAAIIRHQGRPWVYISTDGATFTRRPVTLNHPVDGGWLIAGELTPEQRVVVSGAQMLLSEELKSGISLGD